jgi:hypothetical protein
VDFDVTDIMHSSYCERERKYNRRVYVLLMDLKKFYGSVRREVLYDIIIEFGISM